MSKGFISINPPKLTSDLPLAGLACSAIAIAVMLRLFNLGSREFWYDEVLSLLLSAGQKVAYQTPKAIPVILAKYTALLSLPTENSLSDWLATVDKLLRGLVAEPHPPLFFLTQHLWLRLFGNTEAAMRSIEVLYSLGAMVGAWGIGRCLLGARGGLLLAALLGLNPFYLFHSLNVRMYASLVFWTTLSAWALLELIAHKKSTATEPKNNQQKLWLWSLVFIGSVTAGLMTFYYFAFWLLALAAAVLFLDRSRWWQHALRFSTGVLITTPWVLWGTRQQLRNADFERFSAATGWIETTGKHLEGVLQTLGTQLLLGDWVSSVPAIVATLAGVVAVTLLLGCSVSLWRQRQQKILVTALLLGIFPLLLMLAADIIGNKFTLGFGWGRSLIFILPGCLLLIVAWLERSAGRWQQIAALALLLLYLTTGIADYSLRSRLMFHKLADIIEQDLTTPTLIAINSQAWGHVLRLAYYISPKAPVSLLAQKSASLATALETTLQQSSSSYPRLIWLDSARPVWSAPKTEAEKQQYQRETRAVIDSQYQLEDTQLLLGTMELDRFTVSVYQLAASP